mgnify:FL=1
MALSDLYIAKEYRNLKCDVINDFYIPILSNAVMYKRAVGFFNSAALYEMAIGLKHLVEMQGKMELIVSPRLTEEDIQSITLGYKTREEVIERALLRDFDEPKSKTEFRKLNLLANLIAEGVLDIKVAFKINANSAGIFHEKIGIVIDTEGNKVAFTGSMNETYSGLLQNYESIDVFCSWRDEDYDRVNIKENAFDNLWDNLDTAMEVIPFPNVAVEKLRSYKMEETGSLFVEIQKEDDSQDVFFKIPTTIDLYDYQREAIENWKNNNYCGIFDMATGAGKTFTALGALSSLSKNLNNNIAVVIVAPYQHLVEQWVEDIIQFNVKPIVAYSYPGQKWRKQFSDAVTAYNVGAINNFCVIATNATFSLNDFQSILQKFKKNFAFVVDEAHNFGAAKLSSLLPKKARYRLALSATIERFRDEEGTSKLRKYFGKTCISFSLKEAIQKGFLTSYYYHPVVVYLNADEYEQYKEITKTIIRNGGASQENIEKNPYIEMLLIKRARIISGCKEKVSKLVEVMKPYRTDNYILVYCGATKYDNDSSELKDDDEVRQIEEVNKRLYYDLGMKVHKFTSEESKEERDEIKRMFASGTELQVITAIKCLDEGVNIPAIKKAFILASSTNPKEYIQRRGRVLRRAKGKEYAEIFDFITLPRPLDDVPFCSEEEISCDLSLVRKEFFRMIDFAETARNPFEIDKLKEDIQVVYNQNLTGGYYDE